MVRKIVIAAVIGACITGSAQADSARDGLNYGMMHWIRDTVCTADREIVFVPVSNDVKSRHATWAVIAMDNPDPDSAHIVTMDEKSWLKANGCDELPSQKVQIAEQIRSAGLDL